MRLAHRAAVVGATVPCGAAVDEATGHGDENVVVLVDPA